MMGGVAIRVVDASARDFQTVKSYVRVRPVIEQDLDGTVVGSKTMAPICVVVDADQRTVIVKSKLYEHKQFKCLRAFDHRADQEEVYKKTIYRDIRQGVLKFKKSLMVLAYGNTCAGKSYSIFNYDPETEPQRIAKSLPDAIKRRDAHDQKRHNSDGLAFQCLRDLFGSKEDVSVISIQFCQLYQEKFYDLLANGSQARGRELRESPKTGFYVEGLETVAVNSLEQGTEVIQSGLSARTTRRTSLNIKSSRAHALLSINIRDTTSGDSVTIRFFDLAGSEKQPLSKIPKRGTFMESVNINKSISCLSMVIHRLSAKKKEEFVGFIPFRDSKLTRLLSTSLREGAQISIISHICPTQRYYDSTTTTLRFALKAMRIVYVPSEVESGKSDTTAQEIEVDSGVHQYAMKASYSQSISSQNGQEEASSSYHPYVLAESTTKTASRRLLDDKRSEEIETLRSHDHEDLASITRPTPQKVMQKMYSLSSVERMMRSLKERQSVVDKRRVAAEGSRTSQMRAFQELCTNFNNNIDLKEGSET